MTRFRFLNELYMNVVTHNRCPR